MTEKKRDFTDFSLDEISEIAEEAGKEAGEESLNAGLKVLSKDVETGEFYFEKKNSLGEIERHYISKEEVHRLQGEPNDDKA